MKKTSLQKTRKKKKRYFWAIKKYYAKAKAMEIKIMQDIKQGDLIQIEGKNTFFRQEIKRIEENKKEIKNAKKHSTVGIALEKKAREKDKVFLIV